jgi:hypothetical protein
VNCSKCSAELHADNFIVGSFYHCPNATCVLSTKHKPKAAVTAQREGQLYSWGSCVIAYTAEELLAYKGWSVDRWSVDRPDLLRVTGARGLPSAYGGWYSANGLWEPEI